MPTRAAPSLTREITLILLVKLVLIVAIKLVFFSDPVKPGGEGTAAALLKPSIPEKGVSHE